MRIIDENNVEIVSPDLSLGRIEPDRILVTHHPAIEGVAEQFHYDVIATYPNGGRDLKKVIDVPGVVAQEAWDEYEDVLRYILYTPEELAEIAQNRKPTQEERIANLENALKRILAALTKFGIATE